MTNREAIEALGDLLDTTREYPHLDGMTMFGDAIKVAISALEKQEEDRWIPVTDRLPEEDTDVLVTVHFLGLKKTHPNGWNDHIKPSFYVDIAKHYSGEWCSTSDEYKVARSRHIVIAWRPLPAPYQEDEA